MKGFAILCPGQGAQSATMFELTAAQAAAQLPPDLTAAATNPEQLFANRCAQPLLIAVGMLRWQALRASVPTPSLIAGYSVGELTAYAVAGALDGAASLATARLRAESMDRCVDPAQPHAMLALSGLTRTDLCRLLQQHALHLAIDNGVDRWVVGGLAQQASGLERQVAALGGTCRLLPVAVASHTPLMLPARVSFAQWLATQAWGKFSAPVLRGIDGATIRDAGAAQAALVDQLTRPVRWADCMDTCSEGGIEVALELGPGDALSRLLRTRHPSIACRSIDEFRSLEAAAGWVNRELGIGV